MTKGLFFQALTKFAAGVAVVMALLFIPAGTLMYWQGWLLMGILFVPMLLVGMVLMWRNPDLLRKRLDGREREGEQVCVVMMSSLVLVAMFVLAGLNIRYDWCVLPDWLVILESLDFLLGYVLYVEVMRENVWLSRTIEVQDDQQVVDGGLYGIVRHPMYTATLALFLDMPLVLASPWSFVVMLLYVPIVVKRIYNEEAVLQRELRGYSEYMERVRYRLIPYIW